MDMHWYELWQDQRPEMEFVQRLYDEAARQVTVEFLRPELLKMGLDPEQYELKVDLHVDD